VEWARSWRAFKVKDVVSGCHVQTAECFADLCRIFSTLELKPQVTHKSFSS
jgi:hypothetical protein